MDVDEFPHQVGKIDFGSPLSYADVAPTAERLKEHEQITGSVAFIFIIIALRLSGFCRQGLPHFSDELLAGFVKTDQWTLSIIGLVIKLQYVLHRAYEISILFRRDYPGLVLPGFETVFLSSCRTVS